MSDTYLSEESIGSIDNAIDDVQSLEPSRYKALAITALEEAGLWVLADARKKRGEHILRGQL